jgi:hypothetical protein
MAKMRAVQVARAGGPLELVEREMPEPARAEFHHPVPARGWVPGRVRFGASVRARSARPNGSIANDSGRSRDRYRTT